jgi:hypothetical protein
MLTWLSCGISTSTDFVIGLFPDREDGYDLLFRNAGFSTEHSAVFSIGQNFSVVELFDGT